MRAKTTEINPSRITISQSTLYRPQNMMRLSPIINWDTGSMIKEANKLAARTEVVCEEITTAPDTITIPWAVVKRITCKRS